MVTRKPVGSIDTSNVPQRASPPYPPSPRDQTQTPATASSVYSPDLDTPAAFHLIDVGHSQTRPRRDSDVSSHGTWDTDDEDKEADGFVDVPKPLRIMPSKQNLDQRSAAENHVGDTKKEELPAILRPGPANPAAAASSKSATTQPIASQALANPWVGEHGSGHSQSNGEAQSNNPYLNKPKNSDDPPSTFQQSSIPPNRPHLPLQDAQAPPVELPTVHTPTEEFSKLSFGAASNSSHGVVTGAPTQTPLQTGNSISSLYTDRSDNAPATQNHIIPPTPQQKWGDQTFYPPPPPPGPPPVTNQHSLIDHDIPLSAPIQSQPQAIASQQHPSANASTATPGVPATNQRTENYQIKHINWQDSTSTAVRTSPILTQNANGPCPLLALVNALVLTTPESANTSFIEALRTREHISLGLLLDAVFDELMSGRRRDSTNTLPDVDELYSFLLALHTGMNVNPRFIADNTPTTRSNVGTAGGFEQTKEMRLYSTFNVPLIHGWLPEQGSQAYQAFARCAQSFEDAQNIQFAESELEEKLRDSGLTPQETQLLQDIRTVKHFLTNWPTQLTDTGLEAISSTLKPGQFAILFRNDHFSTIYKEPKHGALLTLITDAGYSSHDEIVWESLVDVNGAASEMFSGDFRVVSHGPEAHLNQGSSAGGQDGWSTVPPRQHQSHQQPGQQTNIHGPATSDNVPPPLPGPRPPTLANTIAQPTDNVTTHQRSRSEQEDHDLALALQLQEEEEAQQRQTEDRRRREQQLTEQFLSTPQIEGRPPTIPPRRSGGRQTTSTRPPVNRPADNADDPDAPPTYEQSASDRPFREAGSTARPTAQTNPLNAYDALRRQQEEQQQQQSAYAQQSANSPYVVSSRQSYGRGRRTQHAATAQDAEDRCAVM